MVVHLDIVVLCLPAVNLSLDFVSVVVEDEEVWADASSQHRTNLLQGLRRRESRSISTRDKSYQLQTAIADK